ncbi:MAG: NAD(P)-binding domain-containing protein [Anaerolineales bacterium]|nr:NAD(P)-binding domain-containing protein [Anaerolineales bacterium]
MPDSSTTYDTLIIGAGPIGVELAIALRRLGHRYLLLESGQVGDFIAGWPPDTRFFSSPEHVALAGVPMQTLDQLAPTGEQYLVYLRMLVEMFDLNLHVYEPVLDIAKSGSTFHVRTQVRTGEQVYAARHVVLCTGGLAGPRLLGIPGESLPHVRHTFPGPHAYFRTRVLIVGGKNSAMEAALRCWRVGAAEVALSYRRPALNFERIKPHLSVDMGDRLQKGEIRFFPATIPVEITPTHVLLACTEDGVTPIGPTTAHETDFVLLMTGFRADMRLFRQAGVTLQGTAEIPTYNPHTMETDVPGLYVAGTAAGGTQERFKFFISTTHDHVARVVRAITGQPPGPLGSVPARNNAVTYEEVKAN